MFTRTLLSIAIGAVMAIGAANAQTKIRIGYGAAAEEQFWLLMAKPDVGTQSGKAYIADHSRFAAADKRFQAFEAGALDVATMSANAALFAAGEGVQFKIIASLAKESPRGFATTYLVKADSPIRTVADMKGKTVSINGFSGSGHLWVQSALEKSGLKESDVTIVPLPFPAQFEALKAGKIDVGMFPQPFLAMAEKEGNVRKLFDSKTGAPYEEELMLLIAKEDWLKANAAAARALLADAKLATDYYLKNGRAAKQALIDAKMVRLDIDVYDGMKDYYRDPTMVVDQKALEMMQEGQLKAGFQKNRADLGKYVDTSYLPK